MLTSLRFFGYMCYIAAAGCVVFWLMGEAMCIGCRRMAPKADLYYNKSADVYYHPECLARDRSR